MLSNVILTNEKSKELGYNKNMGVIYNMANIFIHFLFLYNRLAYY